MPLGPPRSLRRAATALAVAAMLVGVAPVAPSTTAAEAAPGEPAAGRPAASLASDAAGATTATSHPQRSVRVTGGRYHTCAITDHGAVKCWGRNDRGQLGVGDTDNRGDGPGEMGDDLPTVDLGTGRTTTTVTAGSFHTCALLNDGTVKCWGDNAAGQLGLGDTSDRGDQPGEMGDNLPAVDLGTGRTATAVTASGNHTCALLDDGTVKCWGANLVGQLGQGDSADRGDGPGEMGDNLPAVALGTGATPTAVTAGDGHTCALLDDGAVKCWGGNSLGELGQGDTQIRGDGPGEMGDDLPAVDLGTGATAVDAGEGHTCAVLNDGTVKCWGDNSYGKLGLGDTTPRGDSTADGHEMGDHLPAVDLGTGATPTAVAAAVFHTCALLDDGTVKCWGRNSLGQLGLGDTTNRGGQPGEMGDDLPAVDLGTSRTATALTAAYQQACALLDDASIKCWGENHRGQLGQGDTQPRGDEPGEMGDALAVVDLGTEASGIGGRLVDAVSGDGIAHGWVAVLDAVDYHAVAGSYADGSGWFAVTVPPGVYRLYSIDPTAAHTSALHPAPVTVPADTLVGASPALAPARASITGTVTDQATDTPIADAIVLAADATANRPGPTATAGPDGAYRLDGLVPGQYRVVAFEPTGAHQAHFHHETPRAADATIVTVAAGTTTTIGFNPPADTPPTGGATMSGSATAAGTATGIAGAVVIALHAADFTYRAAATAGPDGAYTLDLDPGDYRIFALDPDTYHDAEWHPDHPVTDLAGVPITHLNPGATTVDIDLSPLTGTIAGTVTGTTDAPIRQAWIVAVTPNGTIGGATTTGPDGTYTLTNLAAGTYRVTIADPHHGRPQQWWDHQPDFPAATPLPVTAGTTTTLDATLDDP